MKPKAVRKCIWATQSTLTAIPRSLLLMSSLILTNSGRIVGLTEIERKLNLGSYVPHCIRFIIACISVMVVKGNCWFGDTVFAAVLSGDWGIFAVHWQGCEGHAPMGIWNLLKFSIWKSCEFHTNVTSRIFKFSSSFVLLYI